MATTLLLLVFASTLAPARLAASSLEGRPAPEISAEVWLNSAPLTRADLAGKVTLVEFWTFACSNCRNVEPHVRAWHERYAEKGLVVVAVHTPELPRERELHRVERYVERQELTYPIAVDNDFSTWRAFRNHAWPTLYLVDRGGRIRYVHVGEGAYAKTEAKIEELLAE